MSQEREIARQIAGAVAAKLGDGWKCDTSKKFDDYAGVYIDGPDNARLFLRLDWRNEDRVKVRGQFGGAASPHEIGVSRFRGPTVIANEIRRRLLPDYLPGLAEHLASVNKDRDMEAEREALAADLTPLIPGARFRPGDSRGSIDWYSHDGVRGDIAINYGADRLTLTLKDVPPGLARKIAALIGKHNREVKP